MDSKPDRQKRWNERQDSEIDYPAIKAGTPTKAVRTKVRQGRLIFRIEQWGPRSAVRESKLSHSQNEKK